MAREFYIGAGLVAIDSADSPPSGDNKFFMTAGLVAGDYVAVSGGWPHDLGGTGNSAIGGVGGTDKDNIDGVGGVT